MKAIVRDVYGPIDVLRYDEVDKPVPGDDDLLVKVHATSVNASDWELLRGKPFHARIFGLFTPKFRVLGSDIAGTVEAVGKNVDRYAPGDEVLADTFYLGLGGFAQYALISQKAPLARKPADMTFEQASAIPQASVIALQGLRYKKPVEAGESVLINGCGGGAGTFALQMAKSLGAEVTAVDNTKKLEFMRSLGADRVIDYTREDFTKNGQRYDRILDLAAHRSILDYKRALTPNGIYAQAGGTVPRLFQLLAVGPWAALTGSKKLGVLAVRFNSKDLARVIELFEQGSVAPAIDRTYNLDQVPEALQYLGERRAEGKVVITM
jgi:NADPH:quinone reductase-like Zn-dependent oxidoreductase